MLAGVRCFLPVFADRSGNNPEYLARPGYFYRLVCIIRGNEAYPWIAGTAAPFEILERYFVVERGDDDIAVLWLSRAIENDNIPVHYPGILHAVSFYPYEVRGSRVVDEILVEREFHRGLRFGRERESGPYRFEQRVSG